MVRALLMMQPSPTESPKNPAVNPARACPTSPILAPCSARRPVPVARPALRWRCRPITAAAPRAQAPPSDAGAPPRSARRCLAVDADILGKTVCGTCSSPRACIGSAVRASDAARIRQAARATAARLSTLLQRLRPQPARLHRAQRLPPPAAPPVTTRRRVIAANLATSRGDRARVRSPPSASPESRSAPSERPCASNARLSCAPTARQWLSAQAPPPSRADAHVQTVAVLRPEV